MSQALPLPEVYELHTEFEERPSGRCRVTLNAPGYYVRRTFEDWNCARAYAAFVARRHFPTLFH